MISRLDQKEALEAFLLLLSEAKSFEEDADAEMIEGRWRDCSTFHISVSRSVLETFCLSLGMRCAHREESLKEMIDRYVAAE